MGDNDPREAYDELADTYRTEVETSPYNAYLEFPGTTELIPDVEGCRVLDAGCGTGHYTEWLHDHGATAVGVDASEAMLAQARDRLPADVQFHQADLADGLAFGADSFDGIVSALVLSYIEDWTPVFAEFHRVLRDGGFLVFSVVHPFDEYPLEPEQNYFATEPRTKEWDTEIRYYRRPLTAVLNPLLDAGFTLETIAEPQPTDEFREAWPERYEKESRHPVFLAVHATAD